MWVPLIFLLITSVGAGDMEFLLDTTYNYPTTNVSAYTYIGAGQQAYMWPISFRPPVLGNTSLTVTARGVRGRFLYQTMGAETLAVGVANNPLWARWRYATLSNTTLALTNRRSARVQEAVAFTCNVTSPRPVLCDAGAVVTPYGNFTIILDPQRPRGTLPGYLYFLLGHKNQTADVVGCIPLGPTVQLCDADRAYFDLAEAMHDPVIVIGGNFFRANYSVVELDGWTGAVRFQIASDEQPPYIVQILGLVAAGLTLVLTDGRWATAQETLAICLLLIHHATSRGPARWQWIGDHRLALGSILLLISFVSGITLSWLGASSSFLGQPGEPDLRMLHIALTVYASLQTLGAFILFLTQDVLQQGTRWLQPHPMSMASSWARHLLFSTATKAATALTLMPLTIAALATDVRIVLYVQVVVLGVMFMHHAYYLTGACSHLFVRPSSGLVAFVVGQCILLCTMLVIAIVAFATPLLTMSSSMYGTALNGVAGALLLGFWAVAGGVKAVGEATNLGDLLVRHLITA